MLLGIGKVRLTVTIVLRVCRSISSCWVGRAGQVTSLNIMASGYYMLMIVLMCYNCHIVGVLAGSVKGTTSEPVRE